MSSNISAEAEFLQARAERAWLQDHEYMELLGYSSVQKSEVGVMTYLQHPDEIFTKPKIGLIYFIDNFQAAGDFSKKSSKGSLCWRLEKSGEASDNFGLEYYFATALKRGRPTWKGVKSFYAMNIIRSVSHIHVICHILQKSYEVKVPQIQQQTEVSLKRQKVAEGIDWLLKAYNELEEVQASGEEGLYTSD